MIKQLKENFTQVWSTTRFDNDELSNYAQRFTVSPTIDSDAIRATMRHGVLELVLPKLAEARPRRIDVTAS